MKNKKTKKLFIICLLLLLISGMAIYLINVNGITSNNVDANSNALLTQKLDSNQTNEIEENVEVKINPNIILPGFTDLTISANTTDVNLGTVFYNPIGNVYYNCPICGALLEDFECPRCDKEIDESDAIQNKYYLKFEIYLNDTNELIYTSDLVSPGYHLGNVIINKEIEVGDYNATVNIKPYYSDMATPCNFGSLEITIHATDTI